MWGAAGTFSRGTGGTASSSGVLDRDPERDELPADGIASGATLVPLVEREVEKDRGAVLGRRVGLMPPGVA